MKKEEIKEIMGELMMQLKIIYTKKGFTTAYLAEKTGLSATTVNSVLNNRTTPTIATLIKITDAMGVKIMIEE